MDLIENRNKYVILSFDIPSTKNIGFASITSHNFKIDSIISFCDIIPKHSNSGQRLKYVFDKITSLIIQYSPNVIVVESSLGFGFAKARQNLQESVGVMKLASHIRNIEFVELNPKHIKLVCTGSGNAKKTDMIQFVSHRFNITAKEHEADAVCVGYCYAIDSKIVKMEE